MGVVLAELTIFAVPKSFEDSHVAMIQNNAIQSWCCLDPMPEILLCCDDPGVSEAARRFGCRHVSGVRCTTDGYPFLDDVWARAGQLARSELLVYVNADILLFQDFMSALGKVAGEFAGAFLMVGVRWDWQRPVEILFGQYWAEHVRQLAREQGQKHSDYGIDYFGFRRGMFGKMKPYVIGWYAWDNDTILEALREKIPLVDASHDVFVVHQRHPERIKNRGEPGEQAHRLWNLQLAGGLEELRKGGGGNVSRAPWILKDGKIRRRGR